jgi:hypothetical protein
MTSICFMLCLYGFKVLLCTEYFIHRNIDARVGVTDFPTLSIAVGFADRFAKQRSCAERILWLDQKRS